MSLLGTTKRRLLAVLACGLMLAGGGAGVYAFRQHRVRAQYMAWRSEGMQAAVASDNETAVELLGRYVRRYPEDVDVLVTYARIRPLVKAPDRQHLRDTMLVLRHLLALHPELTEQRRALLRLYADSGYASEAVVTADMVLKSSPKDVEALEIRATSLARKRQLSEALEAAKDWAEQATQDVDAHILCIEMMRANGRSKDEITKVAEGLKKTLADAPSLDVVRGVASNYWTQLVEGESARFELVRGIAAAACDAQGEAATWIRKAAIHPGGDIKTRQGVVRAFDGLGMHTQSLALLKRLVRESGDPGQQRFLIRRLWELNLWDEVLSYPITAGSDLSGDLELKAMIGVAQARTGKVTEAKAVAAELSAARRDPTALAWGEVLGQMLSPESATGTAHGELQVFQAALTDSPSNPYIRCFLGQTYARLGETEQAVACYQQSARQNGTWAAPLLSLAEAYLALGRQEQAFEAAAGALARSNHLGAAVVLATSWNAKIMSGVGSDDAAFQKLLTDIEARTPGQFLVLPERAALMARAGKSKEAGEAIKTALGASPAPSDGVLQRLAAMSRIYKLGLEAQCYDAIEARGGTSATTALSRAVTVYLGGEKESAISQFERSRQQSGKSDSLEWQIASSRLLDFTRSEQAAAGWIALGDGHPDELELQQVVLTARTIRSDRAFMDRTIERVKRLSGGDGVQWRIARARWLLDQPAADKGGAEQASVLLSEVLRLAPDATEARFLQAKSLDRLGNASAAIEQLTTVVKLNPSLQAASLYLAKLLQARGDFTRARDYLERVTRTGLQDEGYRQLAAKLLAQQGDPGEAIQLMENATDTGSENELLLALLYRQQGDLKRAEELCRKLMLKPNLATISLAADVYGALGMSADAKEAISKLKTLNAEPGVEELLLAENAVRYERGANAVDLCRRATQLAPRNAATWKSLVIACLVTGRFADAVVAVEQGLKVIPDDSYLKSFSEVRTLVLAGMSDAKLQSLAIALARDPETAGTREMLQLLTAPGASAEAKPIRRARLKQIANQYPLNLTVQLFAAAKCLEDKDNDGAAALATRAAQSFPTSAQAADLAVNALMGDKRWAEVVTFAKSWRVRNPSAAMNADTLAATAMMEMNQASAAQKELAAYVPKALAKPDENASIIALYAAALHQTGAAAEAERMLQPLLQKGDAVRLAWLACVQRYLPFSAQVAAVLRLTELNDEGSAAWQFQLAGAATSLGVNDARLQAIARQLVAKLVARNDLTPTALAVLASLGERDGNLEQAEALYRKAIAADSTVAVAKNNLAMVIVQRNGDLAEAAKLASDAIASDPSFPNYYDTLARVQAKAGETTKAVETVREATRRDPEHPEWQVSLAERLVEANDPANASAVLGKLKGAMSDELKGRIEALQKVLNGKGPVSTVPR
jgi:tetratricopeptide (TPR) repeat protein